MSDPAPRPVRFGDLGARLASGLALAVIGLAAVWLGAAAFAALVALAAALMLWELHRMVTGIGGIDAAPMVVLVVAGAGAVVATLIKGLPAGAAVVAIGVLAVALLAPKGRSWLAAGLVYVGLAMCFAVALRDTPGTGLALAVWLVLVVVAADVGAYFVGRAVGGPKLWPAVSPGKTWSGALGGLAAAVLAGVAVALVLGWPAARLGALSGAMAVASQAGDLLESAVKRRFGFKDSSRLIPGHGGVMDRLDAIMGALWFTALWGLLGGGVIP
ncbi:phosphatidate cytidylyltransferase [Amaricoccus sp.]|uniref:phosphatidate cytidylyltransferase n=1 Tax=Amaricoccus sp. TaxID=1872485 RepID=UPI001B6267C0|nr:phosphatidate cytidylyltransferase [Amaricoccus sp.]MBP7241690.1 phosphatidate cytidylyltransferase [Amaricoccus sp.]